MQKDTNITKVDITNHFFKPDNDLYMIESFYTRFEENEQLWIKKDIKACAPLPLRYSFMLKNNIDEFIVLNFWNNINIIAGNRTLTEKQLTNLELFVKCHKENLLAFIAGHLKEYELAESIEHVIWYPIYLYDTSGVTPKLADRLLQSSYDLERIDINIPNFPDCIMCIKPNFPTHTIDCPKDRYVFLLHHETKGNIVFSFINEQADILCGNWKLSTNELKSINTFIKDNFFNLVTIIDFPYAEGQIEQLNQIKKL